MLDTTRHRRLPGLGGPTGEHGNGWELCWIGEWVGGWTGMQMDVCGGGGWKFGYFVDDCKDQMVGKTDGSVCGGHW